MTATGHQIDRGVVLGPAISNMTLQVDLLYLVLQQVLEYQDLLRLEEEYL